MRSIKRLVFRILFAVCALMLIVAALVCAEVAASAELTRLAALAPTMSGVPAPYINAPYYSDDFTAESAQTNDLWYFSDDGTVRARDFSGKYFNYRDGIRVTLYQPEQAKHTIHMFGNSSLVSLGVPDEYTIPSLLQKWLNEAGQSYRVVNYGIMGEGAVQAMLRLEMTDIQPGDIVIFYDGGMDARGVRDVADRDRGYDLSNGLCNLLLTRLPRVALVSLPCRDIKHSPAPDLLNKAALQRRVDEMIKHYRRALFTSEQYAREHGATFYHFLQPYLWSKPLSAYEQQVAKVIAYSESGMEQAFVASYPSLKAIHKELLSAGIYSRDLSSILDEQRSGGSEFFFDFAHVNHEANIIIAREIFKVLPAS